MNGHPEQASNISGHPSMRPNKKRLGLTQDEHGSDARRRMI